MREVKFYEIKRLLPPKINYLSDKELEKKIKLMRSMKVYVIHPAFYLLFIIFDFLGQRFKFFNRFVTKLIRLSRRCFGEARTMIINYRTGD